MMRGNSIRRRKRRKAAFEDLLQAANVVEHYDDHGHELRVFAEGRKRHPKSYDCAFCNTVSTAMFGTS